METAIEAPAISSNPTETSPSELPVGLLAAPVGTIPDRDPMLLDLWTRARASVARNREEERRKAIAEAEAAAERVRFSHD
jgi:hypothetical protein